MNLQDMPQIGDLVDGKYTLVGLLGKGGFGMVVEATHVHLQGQRFAIKFLLERQLNDPEERERFNREAFVGTVLESGRNVKVTDAGEFVRMPNGYGFPYIVMEYLEGKDLDALVKKDGPLPIHVAVDYILQACIALAEAHKRGIFHRDLKPANLFLTTRLGAPFVKVLDFGLAKANTASSGVPATTTGVIILSVGFAPPEQQKGLKHAGALSDIFSLGASLYFLLTGKLAFDGGDNIYDLMIAVARDPPIPMRQFRQDVPAGLVATIEWALEKDPKARPQTVVEFARSLVPFGSAEAGQLFAEVVRAAGGETPAVVKAEDKGGTIKIPPEPEPPTIHIVRPPKPRQTNWLLVVLALVALVILLISVALWLNRDSTDPPVTDALTSASARIESKPQPSTESPAPVPTASATALPTASSTTTASGSASSKKPPAPTPTSKSKYVGTP